MLLSTLPQDAWIVIGAAVVLVGVALVFAIARGQAINVAFKRDGTQLDVGVSQPSGTRDRAAVADGARPSVLNNARVKGSDVKVHIGDKISGKHD